MVMSGTNPGKAVSYSGSKSASKYQQPRNVQEEVRESEARAHARAFERNYYETHPGAAPGSYNPASMVMPGEGAGGPAGTRSVVVAGVNAPNQGATAASVQPAGTFLADRTDELQYKYLVEEPGFHEVDGQLYSGTAMAAKAGQLESQGRSVDSARSSPSGEHWEVNGVRFSSKGEAQRYIDDMEVNPWVLGLSESEFSERMYPKSVGGSSSGLDIMPKVKGFGVVNPEHDFKSPEQVGESLLYAPGTVFTSKPSGGGESTLVERAGLNIPISMVAGGASELTAGAGVRGNLILGVGGVVKGGLAAIGGQIAEDLYKGFYDFTRPKVLETSDKMSPEVGEFYASNLLVAGGYPVYKARQAFWEVGLRVLGVAKNEAKDYVQATAGYDSLRTEEASRDAGAVGANLLVFSGVWGAGNKAIGFMGDALGIRPVTMYNPKSTYTASYERPGVGDYVRVESEGPGAYVFDAGAIRPNTPKVYASVEGVGAGSEAVTMESRIYGVVDTYRASGYLEGEPLRGISPMEYAKNMGARSSLASGEPVVVNKPFTFYETVKMEGSSKVSPGVKENSINGFIVESPTSKTEIDFWSYSKTEAGGGSRAALYDKLQTSEVSRTAGLGFKDVSGAYSPAPGKFRSSAPLGGSVSSYDVSGRVSGGLLGESVRAPAPGGVNEPLSGGLAVSRGRLSLPQLGSGVKPKATRFAEFGEKVLSDIKMEVDGLRARLGTEETREIVSRGRGRVADLEGPVVEVEYSSRVVWGGGGAPRDKVVDMTGFGVKSTPKSGGGSRLLFEEPKNSPPMSKSQAANILKSAESKGSEAKAAEFTHESPQADRVFESYADTKISYGGRSQRRFSGMGQKSWILSKSREAFGSVEDSASSSIVSSPEWELSRFPRFSPGRSGVSGDSVSERVVRVSQESMPSMEREQIVIQVPSKALTSDRVLRQFRDNVVKPPSEPSNTPVRVPDVPDIPWGGTRTPDPFDNSTVPPLPLFAGGGGGGGVGRGWRGRQWAEVSRIMEPGEISSSILGSKKKRRSK